MKSSTPLPLWFFGIMGLLSAVFIYAGCMKLADPASFADSVEGFRLVPWPHGITLIALGLPVLEVLLGILLWVRSWRRPALLGMVVLSAVFLGALASAWLRGIAVDCGCLGAGEVTAWTLPLGIARTVLLLGGSAWTYRRCSN